MKVKIFYEYLSSDLEKNINEFIKDVNVLDIKYQYKDTHHTALVLYTKSLDIIC